MLRFTEFVNAEYGPKGAIAFAMNRGYCARILALAVRDARHAVLVDSPEMAADTIAWLTEQRREWLAGRYISANWDMPELEARKDDIVLGDKLKMRMAF